MLALVALPAFAGPLNDTGIDFCRNGTTDVPVTGAASCPASVGPQDGRFGRDAAAVGGTLTKTGAGSKGFDFTKIANNGSSLAASATLGAAATDWGCTLDNNTGLMWELKTTSGLRNQSNTYTWYDSVHNYGGNAGWASGGTCATAGRCDTEKYAADVNAAGLCGHNDWRLPALTELQSLVDFGIAGGGSVATIDASYFPNTPVSGVGSTFWSATPVAGSPRWAWQVGFTWGSSFDSSGANSFGVRLVRP
jgi:hypothetical protein